MKFILPFSVPAILLALLLLLSSFVTPADAWWAKGHMAVAEVAKRHLKPDVLDKVELCVSILRELGPFSQIPDMVEAAPLAQEFDDMGLKTMAKWHYIRTPFVTEDFDEDPSTVVPADPVNVVTTIRDLRDAIKNPAASSDIITKSVLNLIHFVGDVHQPLNAINRWSEDDWKGDNGGEFTVFSGEGGMGQISLSSYWESMGEGTAQTNNQRPLSVSNRKKITELGDYLEAKYNSIPDEEKNMVDPVIMANESYWIARDFAYEGVKFRTELSADYKATAKITMERRISLAGYRLAAMLNDALSGVSTGTIRAGLTSMEEPIRVKLAKNGLSTGKTVGIAVGVGVAGILIAAAICFALLCIFAPINKQSSAELDDDEMTLDNEPTKNADSHATTKS